MRASGNSMAQVCVDNLLKTTKGDVPYARAKGVYRNIVDATPDIAKIRTVISADECIGKYETRVTISNITEKEVDLNGNLIYIINAKEN